MFAAIGKFLVRLVISYLIVFFGTLLMWEVLGVVDREGGKAMALAFFIAPVAALLSAILWPAIRSALSGHRPNGDGNNTNEKTS